MEFHCVFERHSAAPRISGRANLNLKELFADFILLQILEIVFGKRYVAERISKTVILPQIFLTVGLRHLLVRLLHRIPIDECEQFWLADLGDERLLVFRAIYFRININAIHRQQLKYPMLLADIPQLFPKQLWRTHHTDLFTFDLVEAFGLNLLAVELLNRRRCLTQTILSFTERRLSGFLLLN